MTKIEELEQKLNELKYQIRNTVEGFEETCEEFEIEIHELKFEYQKALAELKESKKEGKWKPNYNEVYWFRDISNDGEIEQCKWYGEGMDIWRFNNIPIFKTEEECERYWHFMDAVKEKSYEFSKEDFENHNIRKHIIYYDFERKCFDIDRSINIKYFGEIYFKTEEDAKYIIDNFKDELMEYWI